MKTCFSNRRWRKMQGSWIPLSQSNGKVEPPIAEEGRSWIRVDETSKWKSNRRCEKRQESWIPYIKSMAESNHQLLKKKGVESLDICAETNSA
jgi:hypothetical protein